MLIQKKTAVTKEPYSQQGYKVVNCHTRKIVSRTKQRWVWEHIVHATLFYQSCAEHGRQPTNTFFEMQTTVSYFRYVVDCWNPLSSVINTVTMTKRSWQQQLVVELRQGYLRASGIILVTVRTKDFIVLIRSILYWRKQFR